MPFPTDLLSRLQGDAAWSQLAADTDVIFTLSERGGGEVTIALGRTSNAPEPDFRVVLDEADWDDLLAPHPKPGRQHVAAFIAPRGSGAVEGDRLAYAQHLHLVRRAVEVARGGEPAADVIVPARLDAIQSRYVRVEVDGWGTCDVFVESAGTGTPVVLLHTAGADSRQYQELMTDERLTREHRLIAFDLPWHGRSNPAHGARSYDYWLDTQTYTDCIAAVIEALDLSELPIIMGASMAGAAVIQMVALHPQKVLGAVSCQAGPRVGNRHTPYLRNAKVNQTLHVPEWTYGLMSPDSPESARDRVWWGYSQGGWGIYERDISYYSQDWDIDDVAHLFSDTTPPVVLMNGQFDFSVPPAATQELLDRIPGSAYRAMPELGHFPHAENPPVFANYLLDALDHIELQRAV